MVIWKVCQVRLFNWCNLFVMLYSCIENRIDKFGRQWIQERKTTNTRHIELAEAVPYFSSGVSETGTSTWTAMYLHSIFGYNCRTSWFAVNSVTLHEIVIVLLLCYLSSSWLVIIFDKFSKKQLEINLCRIIEVGWASDFWKITFARMANIRRLRIIDVILALSYQNR